MHQLQRTYLTVTTFLLICFLFTYLRMPLRFNSTQKPWYRKQEQKRLVIASLQGDDVSWVKKRLPDWPVSRYIVDNETASLTVPKNKGREAMVYLTYLIDNYDNLPEISVFIHGEQYQWHNDDPNKDSGTVLSRLQLSYVLKQGYVNLRCAWVIGCPDEIHLNETNSIFQTSIAFKNAYSELFPENMQKGIIPEVVGAACCAQFVVSATKVRERPRSDYERYRNWLLHTSLDDAISGRVLEYSWHMIFGMPAVFCPAAKDCYCKVFGMCELADCSKQGCGGQYTLPKYSNKPPGWKPLPEFEPDLWEDNDDKE